MTFGVATQHEALLVRVRELVPDAFGAMLYGSHARGNARADSDIDVLTTVDNSPGSIESGALTITSYLPAHLRFLAERGSLFALHLAHDGVILTDPRNDLVDALSAYQPPSDPDRLRIELSTVAGALLTATASELDMYGSAIQGLAFYVLRSAVYDACARAGEPEFDIEIALDKQDLGSLKPLFRTRRHGHHRSLMADAIEALHLALPGSRTHPWTGIRATLVATALDCPAASDLLASVIAGEQIDYTALTLPPI